MKIKMETDTSSSESDVEGPILSEARLFRKGIKGVEPVRKHKAARKSYVVKRGGKPVNRRVLKACPLCPSVSKQIRRHINTVHKDEPTKTRYLFTCRNIVSNIVLNSQAYFNINNVLMVFLGSVLSKSSGPTRSRYLSKIQRRNAPSAGHTGRSCQNTSGQSMAQPSGPQNSKG